MSLPGQQLDRICNAIRAAYTPDSLAQMVRTRLDERLYDVAGGEDFTAVVFHLVEWSQRHGRLPELLQAAQAENPDNPDLAAVMAFVPAAPPGGAPQAAAGPWYVPFERNPAFFGRTEDLDRLHAALSPRSRDGDQAVVRIRPAGVTGMGGMGKTQLAVEYAFRHRAEYPGGVFWLNAAGDWRAEFAGLGVYLDPARAGEPQEAQIRAAADYLQAHADCLLVLDNVEDPQLLRQPVTRFLVPSALPCPVLFTTRRHDLGDFRPVELPVLPEGPGLQLLLRHPARQAVLELAHPEHGEAVRIYAMVGGLPLALEIAGAHLGRRSAASLVTYGQELLRRGALAVVDDPRGGVRGEELGTRHAAAVAATLAEQWEGLGEDARLLLRMAGQLPEAAVIPLARLGLLVGLTAGSGGDFFGDPLGDATRELVAASLLEDLRGDLVRLHPLVRAFAARQTAEGERQDFRWECGSRLIVAYDDLAVLEGQCARRGIDAVEQDLLAGLSLLDEAGSSDPSGESVSLLLRAVRQESHTLRGWDARQNPALFREQWLKRMVVLSEDEWIDRARRFLMSLPCSHLEVIWTTAQSGTTLVRTLSGHTSYVWTVAVTPDGRRAVSGSADHTVRVWDLTSGETVRILSGHTGSVYAVAVTPDGRHAVSGSTDKTVRVWDLTNGKTVGILLGHTDTVCAVAVTPDGRRAMSGSADHTLRLWDLTSGKTLHIFRGHDEQVQAVAVTPDGRYAVSVAHDCTLRLWNLASGKVVRSFGKLTEGFNDVAVTSDGLYAVSGSADGALQVWELKTGLLVRTISRQPNTILAVAVTPDGQHVVSGLADKRVKVWDLWNNETVQTIGEHGDPVMGVAVAPNGRYIVSASFDKTLRVWELRSSKSVSIASCHSQGVPTVAVTPDCQYAISGSWDNTLRVWDLQSGESPRTLNGHTDSVWAVVVTPDGRHAVSGSRDGMLLVWDIHAGEIERSFSTPAEPVFTIALTPDGHRVISNSRFNALRVWDLHTGKTVRTLTGHTDWVSTATVTPDGRHVISGSDDTTLRLWDLQSGKPARTLIGHTDWVRAVAVMSDGRHAISGSNDKTLRMWDLTSGNTVRTFLGHTGLVWAVAGMPDGCHAVSGSNDTSVRVWDLGAGTETAGIVLEFPVYCIAPASDGKTIMASDAAGNLWCLRYRVPPG